MEIYTSKEGFQCNDPTWTGDGFAEDVPQKLWQRLPESLKKIALEEIGHGNKIWMILENQKRNIVLVSFKEGPLVDKQSDDFLRIHTRYDTGNYCYDGTKATYEDVKSGCFLSFEDPEYEEPDYINPA